jgi:hypothetical protein
MSVAAIDTGYIGYISIITDSSGQVDWISAAAGSGSSVVKVLTYQILQ